MKNLLVCLILVHVPSIIFAQKSGEPLPPWKEGYLDIHHINTGHGVCAFFILPDGTTMVVDAGEMDPTSERIKGPRNSKMHPNDSKAAFEWIVDYIRAFHPKGNAATLDYALITHFHDDHFGLVHEKSPKASNGDYYLTGITGVGDKIKIKTLLDRGYPDYNYPYDMRGDSIKKVIGQHKEYADEYLTMVNYWKFGEVQSKLGMKIEKLQAGSHNQIVLVNSKQKFPTFNVINVKANGTIWTGEGNATMEWFPKNYISGENPLSLALRVDYADFRYYTGGDNPGIADLGDSKYNDVETPMSKSIGEVDVAVMDHHGNRDAHNEFNVRTLKPRVWIEQSWSSDHPGHEVLRRITSKYLYPEERDLFATNMLEANKNVIGPSLEKAYKSMDGHIVLRVEPGAKQYYIIILNDENERREVKAVHGPYHTKRK
ncbi:MAG: hypothetical protein WKF87_12085 [Chryseolinea sp.]